MLFTGASSAQADSAEPRERKPELSGAAAKRDPNRFYCPYEGCNRSFAELWRLKVHYRAAPDVRGSGKERGHGAELESCPKCGAELKPGRHHVGCAAGKHAAAQQERRRSLKGRKKSSCRGGSSSASSPSTKNSSMQVESPTEKDMVLGVPVSWMPLDFDQFFLPMQRVHPGWDQPDLMPEHDSVASLVYGNHGEMPTMAMAQVGTDSDFGLDFNKFFNDAIPTDPSVYMNLPPINEDRRLSGLLEDDFFMTKVEPFSDGLDQFLKEEPDFEEDMTDITGKKRDRRSSLEQRLERRNGKDKNRGRDRINEPDPSQPFLLRPETQPLAPMQASQLNYVQPREEIVGYPGHTGVDAFPMELPVDTDPLSDSLLPYSVSEVGKLVQDMVGFDIRHQQGGNGVNDSLGDDR